MGAAKCLPQKEAPVADVDQQISTAGMDSELPIEDQLRGLQKKYAMQTKALEAQKQVCVVQEKRIDEFQADAEQSKNELNDFKKRGGASVAISQVMMKFANEGKGKAAPRKVTFIHSDSGENTVILTTESSGADKRYIVDGVSSDVSSVNLSKLKAGEEKRILVLNCEGKKIPLLVDNTEIRDKWLQTIDSCLNLEVKE